MYEVGMYAVIYGCVLNSHYYWFGPKSEQNERLMLDKRVDVVQKML